MGGYIGYDPNGESAGAIAAAEGYADQAQTTLKTFQGMFYGSASSDPATDPLGALPTDGDTYWNSTYKVLMVRQGGSWERTRADYTSNVATGGGTADAGTATVSPAPASLTNMLSVRVAWVGANTSTTPNFNLNGLGAKTICKADNKALAVGDISGAGFVADLIYSVSFDKWVLMNPGAAVPFTGLQSLWIPAAAMVPRLTNGPSQGQTETSTNKVQIRTLDFDASTTEYAQFQAKMPKGWDEGTITFYAVWSHAATTVNFGVVWGLRGMALSDGNALDTAMGTARTVLDTGGTTDTVYHSAISGAMTLGNGPAEGDYVVFEVFRLAASGPTIQGGDATYTSDTMAIDARLHGILAVLTMNSATDA